jgi:hypothetical protein
MRFADSWRPPILSAEPERVAVGQVIAWDYRAWEVLHVDPMTEPDADGRDTRVVLHRLHGPAHDQENDRQDIVFRVNSRWRPEVYRDGRVWLCSCCGHPAPCRLTLAEEEARRAARVFEERLARMGPGLCYACGEVITTKQERVTFPGEHADFPGRGAPTFHTRKACLGERMAYARRAGLDRNGLPLLPPCEGIFTGHHDGTYECTSGADCPGSRAAHRVWVNCHYAGCTDDACKQGRWPAQAQHDEYERREGGA